MIARTVDGINIKDAIKDTLILFIPMILVLVFVILMPDAMLWLLRNKISGEWQTEATKLLKIVVLRRP